MNGETFDKLKSVEEVVHTILSYSETLPTEQVALAEVAGRVLAEAIIADTPLPRFDNSAVDGYAVVANATRNASPTNPVVLQVLGTATAGNLSDTALTANSAIRIMTGAPMPLGADSVVMLEDTRLLEDSRVEIWEEATIGQHIRSAGSDVPFGATLLTAGTKIRGAEVAMLAAMGRTKPLAYRKPRIALFSTGDEVVEPAEGVVPPEGKIRNSNRPMLEALIQRAGGSVVVSQHLKDDPTGTELALREVCAMQEPPDAIITSGGVSVGDKDFIRPVVERLGELIFWRVAMKPGKPLAFGKIGKTLFFGLPGNPVSSLVTFHLFVEPALRKMQGMGEDALFQQPVDARLDSNLAHTPGRREYVRAMTKWTPQGYSTTPSGEQASYMLQSLTQANSLIIVPEEVTNLVAGEMVKVMLMDF